jgi:predicted TIM-barrel fold metal-dependent hydrolase
LRPLKLKLPPGACDTHFHFLGPQREFPFNPNRNFVPDVDHDDSTISDWQQMQSMLGLSRGLLVQSMMYYPGYELALHALCLMPDRLRAVVSPRPEITDREIGILTRAGVVGTRFTRPTGAVIDDRVVRRTHEFGWGHYLLHDEKQMWAWRNQILRSPGKFVIEHLGSPPVEQGIDSPTFKFVLECIDTGRCWVKLSPRPSKHETFPFSDVLPLVKQLVARAPNRLLWGSDWPHPQYWRPMPSDSDLLDMMLGWVPDERTRNRIFVKTRSRRLAFQKLKGATRRSGSTLNRGRAEGHSMIRKLRLVTKFQAATPLTCSRVDQRWTAQRPA